MRKKRRLNNNSAKVLLTKERESKMQTNNKKKKSVKEKEMNKLNEKTHVIDKINNEEKKRIIRENNVELKMRTRELFQKAFKFLCQAMILRFLQPANLKMAQE